MSVTLCIKYALGYVTVENVTWLFDELFGEKLVMKVTEIVKKDRYNGKNFKMFFIECDKAKQTKTNLDKLVRNIEKNEKGARVTIDSYGHYWQVILAREKPTQVPFKPSIVEESEVSHEPGQIFEIEVAEDDPLMKEAMEDAAMRAWPMQAPR